MARRLSPLIASAWIPALGVLPVAGPSLAQPAPPPIEAFYTNPDIQSAALSPSGRYLAMSTNLAGGRNEVIVVDLKDNDKLSHAAHFSDGDIGSFAWVNDDWLVFNGIDLESGGGDQRYAPGLFSVRRDGSDARMLVKTTHRIAAREHAIAREPLAWNHGLLHLPADGSDDIIVGEIRSGTTDQDARVIPKRLNVSTGRATSLALGAPEASRWWFDAKGQPVLAAAQHGGRLTLSWRDDDKWRVLADQDALTPAFAPRFVAADGTLFVTVAEGQAGTAVLTRFDFKANRPEAEPMVRAKGFDFSGELVTGHTSGQVLGVRVATDAETTVWFDTRLKALQAEADRRLPGLINRLTCRRCDAPDMVVLIESWSDRDPGRYTTVEVDKNLWRSIGHKRKAIDPAQMGAVEFERIRSRDGRDLPLWLTSPAGPRSDKPLPTVVLVHGGPWVRSHGWRWNADAQFLASRGYLVIEPDFRGTEGYGVEHVTASFRQWGLAMQDDVADALLWAVKQRRADPKRACIAGASYGGYAALMGLVRQPELYRCGAAWVAVTDPRLLFEWTWRSDVPDEFRNYGLPRLLGDPVTDADRLRAAAPVEQAARIKSPVLLAMGALDRRVPLAHGTRMQDALKAAGNPPEWIVYPDEGHGWLKVANRLDFARRLEAFLARNLK